MVQRGHNYAIVDEVDSILVDEARTPLIISGPLDDRSDLYNTIDAFLLQLQRDDYEIDEKQRSATSPKTARKSSKACSSRPAFSRASRSMTSRTSRSSITSTMRSRPTSSSSATRTISSAMAKSSSSTNSPDA